MAVPFLMKACTPAAQEKLILQARFDQAYVRWMSASINKFFLINVPIVVKILIAN